METFLPAGDFRGTTRYLRDRHKVMRSLDIATIDPPIAHLIVRFNSHPECFTLQSCWGHFLWTPGQDERNLERIPANREGLVDYRIAYIALCIENNPAGRNLRDSLEAVPSLDPDYIQFGSAGWYKKRHENVFGLQVEPLRYAHKDRVVLDWAEAVHVERTRDRFFNRLENLLDPE